VEPAAGEKRIAVSASLGGSGGVACSPHLERVLLNLLQNAVRHTPEDGTVRIEAHRAGERIELAVEDDGDGIATEELPRVFEPFWRGDRARSTPGSGLGLALAKRIVEALGGEISAESEPLRGARFLVTLPC